MPAIPGQDRCRACRTSAAEIAHRLPGPGKRQRRGSPPRPQGDHGGRDGGGRAKAQAGGMRASVIGLLGLGGTELSVQHAEETGRVVSAMDPEYFSMLTVMLIPGTELYRQWRQGTFELPQPEDLLQRTAAGHRALRRPFPLCFPHQPCLELPAAGGNAVARQSRVCCRH